MDTIKQVKKINKSNKTELLRFLHIILFAGNVASAIMYTQLISNPETGMFVLAGFNIVSAGYFIQKAIK